MPSPPQPTMINQTTYEALGARLIEAASKAEAKILAQVTTVAKKLTYVPTAQMAAASTAATQKVVKEFAAEAKTWAHGDLVKSYLAGLSDADQELAVLGKLKPSPMGHVATLPTEGLGFGISLPPAVAEQMARLPQHHQALGQFIRAAEGKASTMGLALVRGADDAVKEVTAALFKDSLSETTITTRLATSQRVMNGLAEKGIGHVTYANGRKVTLEAYAEMAARTTAGRAAVTANLARFQEAGYDLVIVSAHFRACDICAPWENRILSQNGNHPKYASLQEALDQGLLHPNCAHDISPYFEGMSKKFRPERQVSKAEAALVKQHGAKKARQVLYQAQAKQRYLERGIRQWKRRAAVGDPKAAAQVRKWQARMRGHLKEHSFLPRKYYREAPFIKGQGVPPPLPKKLPGLTHQVAASSPVTKVTTLPATGPAASTSLKKAVAKPKPVTSKITQAGTLPAPSNAGLTQQQWTVAKQALVLDEYPMSQIVKEFDKLALKDTSKYAQSIKNLGATKAQKAFGQPMTSTSESLEDLARFLGQMEAKVIQGYMKGKTKAFLSQTDEAAYQYARRRADALKLSQKLAVPDAPGSFGLRAVVAIAEEGGAWSDIDVVFKKSHKVLQPKKKVSKGAKKPKKPSFEAQKNKLAYELEDGEYQVEWLGEKVGVAFDATMEGVPKGMLGFVNQTTGEIYEWTFEQAVTKLSVNYPSVGKAMKNMMVPGKSWFEPVAPAVKLGKPAKKVKMTAKTAPKPTSKSKALSPGAVTVEDLPHLKTGTKFYMVHEGEVLSVNYTYGYAKADKYYFFWEKGNKTFIFKSADVPGKVFTTAWDAGQKFTQVQAAATSAGKQGVKKGQKVWVKYEGKVVEAQYNKMIYPGKDSVYIVGKGGKLVHVDEVLTVPPKGWLKPEFQVVKPKLTTADAATAKSFEDDVNELAMSLYRQYGKPKVSNHTNIRANPATRMHDKVFNGVGREYLTERHPWLGKGFDVSTFDDRIISEWSGASVKRGPTAIKLALREGWGEKIEKFYFGYGKNATTKFQFETMKEAFWKEMSKNYLVAGAARAPSALEVEAFFKDFVKFRKAFVKYYARPEPKLFRGHSLAGATEDIWAGLQGMTKGFKGTRNYAPNGVASWSSAESIASGFGSLNRGKIIFRANKVDNFYGSYLENGGQKRWSFGAKEKEFVVDGQKRVDMTGTKVFLQFETDYVGNAVSAQKYFKQYPERLETLRAMIKAKWIVRVGRTGKPLTEAWLKQVDEWLK